MRDPHVQALHYQVSSEGGVTYKDPDTFGIANALAEFTIENSRLIVKPKEHFGSEDDARSAIEPFLRAWEMYVDLTANIGTIRFKFDRADVIDRDPPKPGGARIVAVRGASISISAVKAKITLQRSRYPSPPSDFSATPDVETVYRRWLSFKEGKEPLQSMAYFVLSVLELAAGGRKQAAATYHLDGKILAKIGELSSTRGDGQSARKASATFMELSSAENRWLEEAVRQLIHRMGEHAAEAHGRKLGLGDLPALSTNG